MRHICIYKCVVNHWNIISLSSVLLSYLNCVIFCCFLNFIWVGCNNNSNNNKKIIISIFYYFESAFIKANKTNLCGRRESNFKVNNKDTAATEYVFVFNVDFEQIMDIWCLCLVSKYCSTTMAPKQLLWALF